MSVMLSDRGSKPPAGKDDSQASAGRKTAPGRPQEPALKCPRCDSPNTKFCYYNNYSLAQPRHFCKTCRRYWTKGGALRNVPIGGGCRKNKKMVGKASPRLSGESSKEYSSCSSDVGGLTFFQGISPAMDFQFGGMNMAFPRLQSSPSTGLVFNQFGDISSNTSGAISSNPSFSLDPNMGFTNFPNFPSGREFQEMGSLNAHSSLASSIESLSSINQDLHWKLQQQRLSMVPSVDHQPQKPQPIMFDISKQLGSSGRKDGACGSEWLYDNSYTTMAAQTTPPTSGNQNTSNSWTGIQTWSSDLGQYTASLP